jgi:type I restriction enzyme S subunit
LPEAARAGGDIPVFGSNGQVGRHDEALTSGPTIVIGRKGSFGEVTYSPVSCWPIDTTYFVDESATNADLRWLTHRLSTLGLNTLNRAAAIPGLNREDAYRLRFLLPPPAEQRRIAKILDKADALRAKRRIALAQVDALAESTFLDMVGDAAFNPHRFPRVELARLIRNGDTINYGVVQPGDQLDDGVPLIRVGDLVDGSVNQSLIKRIAPNIEARYRRSRLRGDEVLVSCVGSIGIVALADESVRGYNVARAVARLPLAPTVDRTFIAAYLATPFVQRYFKNELRTVSQPTLNIKQLAATPVVLPPVELQREFAHRVSAIHGVRVAQRASATELDSLFASLQHRAFNGEL